MGRLNSPHKTILSKGDFEEYPVWVWDDENVGYLPLSKTEPVTGEYGTLLIKADLEAGGHKFKGYLVGISSFYAFGIFIDNQEVIINLNLLEDLESQVEQICKVLDCKPFSMFPLQYDSPIVVNGKKITGILSPN